MTERDFRAFLNHAQAKGKLPMASGSIDKYDGNESEGIRKAGEYCASHSILFEGHDKLSIELVVKIGRMIQSPFVSIEAKEAALMILAHHPSKEALFALKRYNQDSDKALRYTAQMALQECEMWNE